jgi:D-serine deaminase-like pyridoxal phosphate-dependent protein
MTSPLTSPTASLVDLNTPAALVDTERMQRNIALMQSRLNALGVAFRPHVKTAKSLPIAKAQIEAGARGITVSTLKEAEQFFAAGITDVLYAVGIAAPKLRQAAALIQQGCALKIIADSAEAARAIVEYSSKTEVQFEVWIEIDTDGHRAGVLPESALLLEIGRILAQAGALGGVMTHAGASYALSSPEALQAMAEQERSRCVRAATRLREAGLPCPVVSVGSTPTALSAAQLEGVTEVRAGVYVFFDLVMCNVGVCRSEDVALSVLTTVIGHNIEKGWAIVDAGWMAMSRDRGTQSQSQDYGYGQVCDVQGKPIAGYIIESANQEHGLIARQGSIDSEIARTLPVGTLLRIFPNHACATAAQFPHYEAVQGQNVIETWPRFYGW